MFPIPVFTGDKFIEKSSFLQEAYILLRKVENQNKQLNQMNEFPQINSLDPLTVYSMWDHERQGVFWSN